MSAHVSNAQALKKSVRSEKELLLNEHMKASAAICKLQDCSMELNKVLSVSPSSLSLNQSQGQSQTRSTIQLRRARWVRQSTSPMVQ